jgi:hypothetical protein
VCSADTRDLRRDGALSDVWSDDVDTGEVIVDIIEDMVDELVYAASLFWLRLVNWKEGSQEDLLLISMAV